MNAVERQFVRTVKRYYAQHGRTMLPWRRTQNPYHILVSEIMLQQTQVDRVVPKYAEFLKTFPTVRSLAQAPLGAVLRAWQGLGYNRRAKMLKAAAQVISTTYAGRFPRTFDTLVALPGVGPYTAAAVLAFAYNVPLPLIETNVRSVFIHHFFTDRTDVTDQEILKLVLRTLDKEQPRMWYASLMDYGTYIKKTYGNPNKRSRQHVVQSSFSGSDRQIRGAIVRTLAAGDSTQAALCRALPFDHARIATQIAHLMREGMVLKNRRRYTLPS
jgi:A/G-specific adenine glycosylase